MSYPYFEIHPNFSNPVITASTVTDLPNCDFVADPFLRVSGDNYYLYFEAGNRDRIAEGKLHIASAISVDGFDWEYTGLIITEDFTQSYPSLIYHDNNWFMIPSGQTPDGKVWIYKMNSHTDWNVVEKIQICSNWGDVTPVQIDGLYYMFFQGGFRNIYPLRLYYSENLFGKWIEHPYSPLLPNSRPAGPIIRYEDRIFLHCRTKDETTKVVQIEIEDLNPNKCDLAEKPKLTGVQPRPITNSIGSWNALHMHHLCPSLTPHNNKFDLIAVDGKGVDLDWAIGFYTIRPDGPPVFDKIENLLTTNFYPLIRSVPINFKKFFL